MCVVHVITDRYAATLPTSATATGTCLRNHPPVRSNRFICWAAPAKFSSEILPRLLSGTFLFRYSPPPHAARRRTRRQFHRAYMGFGQYFT